MAHVTGGGHPLHTEAMSACERCGASFRTPVGLCAGCVLLGAASARPPASVGAYDLLEIIGRGGMGVVHRACHREAGQEVALKRIRAGELATEEELARFLIEARAASRLVHDNIVRIYHIEADPERPWFTMELLAESLDTALERFRTPRRAAALLATVSRAVHFAHDRGVLHRDLKPANILLREDGVPRVADFGVAKLDDVPGEAGHGVGTIDYMSPEQAAGHDVTRAADVWSLGAILYELLAGTRPFTGKNAAEIERRVREEQPVRLASIDRDLEAICLRCLKKDPAERYRSASELADDLQRYLAGDAILTRPTGPWGRAWRWARRRPIATAALLGVVGLVAGVVAASLSVARAQEEELRQETRRMNEYAARAMAGAVLFQLDQYSDQATRIVSDPRILAVVRGKTCDSEYEGAEELLAPFGAGTRFDSISIFDDLGRSRARWPAPLIDDYFCRDFSWRSYFKEARLQAKSASPAVTIGRAVQSEANGNWRISLSAPILDENGAFAGVVSAAVASDSSLGAPDDLGALVLGFPGGDRRRTAALAGPRDNVRECRDCPLPDDVLVLVHPSLQRGVTVSVESPMVQALVAASSPSSRYHDFRRPPQALAMSDDDYLDPFDGQRWIAGAAPVGATGYVAIVQTRWDAAVEPNVRLAHRLIGVGGAALALTVLSATILALWSRSRSRRERSLDAL